MPNKLQDLVINLRVLVVENRNWLLEIPFALDWAILLKQR